MPIHHRRVALGAGLIMVGVVAMTSCTSGRDSAATTAASGMTSEQDALVPVLSVQELMEDIIDPTADWIFDAAVVDVTAKGTVETKPVNDEEWLKVERGAVLLAEASNLLKMRRHMVPPGSEPSAATGRANAPELSPAEIEARINQDRSLWNRHADELRVVALDSLRVVKARDSAGLFRAGGEIDKACESCHLEYWYPGDKKAVLEDQNKHVTISPPAKP